MHLRLSIEPSRAKAASSAESTPDVNEEVASDRLSRLWYFARLFASLGMFVVGAWMCVSVLIGHPVAIEVIVSGAGYGFMAGAAAMLMGVKWPSK